MKQTTATDAAEPLSEMPPDSVWKTLRSRTLDSEDLTLPETRLSLAGDIGPDGRFGERWLIVDQTTLRVLTLSDGRAHLDLELPLSDLRQASAESRVGNGLLTLTTRSGQTLEALRYTAGLGPAFAAAARALEAYIQNTEPPSSLGLDIAKKACPKCGDPLPDDTAVCAKCVDKRAVLGRLMRYAKPYQAKVILIGILMIAATALTLLPQILAQRLTDEVLIPHRHFAWVGGFVLAAIAATLVGLGMAIWRGRVSAWISNHMAYTLRTQAYDCLQALSLSYYDKRQTGNLLARVTQDVNELQTFIVDGLQIFVVNILQIIGTLAILLHYNWLLTLLVLVPLPLVAVLSRGLTKKLWGRLHRMYHLRAGLSGAISAVLSGVRVVKAFAQEDREADRFRQRAYDLFGAGLTVEQSWHTYFPILGFLSTIGVFVIQYVGGVQAFHNTTNQPGHGMTVGVLILFLGLLAMLMAPVQQLTRLPDWLSRSSAAAERVFEVIDAEPDVQDTADAVAMPHIQGHVELRNVRFSYDKNQNVLDDVSVDVAPGEMIGLVGHSGAGKSTIINLLSRFYDVKDGQILVDGVDIRQIKQNDLRRQVGVVLQEPFLFPGTIADNIAYAKPEATSLEVMRAAKTANAHDFIMRFPDGYDTWVGERGARLSGGERQRISIARAILHDPRILILDEATASVDTETEKQIQEAIGRLTTGRTTFAIAHRLSTLRNASRLMVMERGKLVELGTHDELLADPEGVFKKLVDMQQEVNRLQEVDGTKQEPEQ